MTIWFHAAFAFMFAICGGVMLAILKTSQIYGEKNIYDKRN